MSKPLIVGLLALAAALLLPQEWLFAVGCSAILFFLIVDPKAVRGLRHPSFWLIAVLLVLIQPLLFGPKESMLLGITFSRSVMMDGAAMTVRAAMLMAVFIYITRSARPASFRGLLRNAGFDAFPGVLSEAQIMVPHFRGTLQGEVSSLRNKTARRAMMRSPVEWSARILAAMLKYGASNESKRV